jgi:protease YdgD
MLASRALAITLVLTAADMASAQPQPTAQAATQPVTGIIGSDDRELLDPTKWPWLAIGRVNRTSGGFCTGTLVGPDLVLTARHCLVNPRTGRRVQPDTIHFLAGYRRGEWLRHGVARAFILPEPDAGRGAGEAGRKAPADDGTDNLADDWVLVILEDALDIRPVPVGALPRRQAAGIRLARAGYGRDRPHLPSLHDGCALLGQEGNVLLHDCDATFGDSGSPLLVLNDGGAVIVGMTTGAGNVNGKHVGIAIDVRAFVDPIRDRIRQAATTANE